MVGAPIACTPHLRTHSGTPGGMPPPVQLDHIALEQHNAQQVDIEAQAQAHATVCCQALVRPTMHTQEQAWAQSLAQAPVPSQAHHTRTASSPGLAAATFLAAERTGLVSVPRGLVASWPQVVHALKLVCCPCRLSRLRLASTAVAYQCQVAAAADTRTNTCG